VSICGEGPSNLPDFTEFLVSCGIDSISVNADSVVATRQLVKSVEQKIVLKRLAEISEKRKELAPQKPESVLTWAPEWD
jgi:pyruvate,water dikinase